MLCLSPSLSLSLSLSLSFSLSLSHSHSHEQGKEKRKELIFTPLVHYHLNTLLAANNEALIKAQSWFYLYTIITLLFPVFFPSEIKNMIIHIFIQRCVSGRITLLPHFCVLPQGLIPRGSGKFLFTLLTTSMDMSYHTMWSSEGQTTSNWLVAFCMCVTDPAYPRVPLVFPVYPRFLEIPPTCVDCWLCYPVSMFLYSCCLPDNPAKLLRKIDGCFLKGLKYWGYFSQWWFLKLV